jgi:multiple antibiotic resistance protein
VNGDLFARVFVTALVILDPVGNVPTFLSLTRTTPHRRSRAALQATLVAAVVILAFALFGERLLELLSISVESLQVSGGLVLVLVALELLGTDGPAETDSAPRGNVALVPLGTPLLAGPGAIAAAMVYMRAASDTAEAATVAGALLAALVVVYAGLRFAAVVARLLGDNGIELLSRIVGLVLGAIAVQLVAEGVDAWVRHGVR